MVSDKSYSINQDDLYDYSCVLRDRGNNRVKSANIVEEIHPDSGKEQIKKLRQDAYQYFIRAADIASQNREEWDRDISLWYREAAWLAAKIGLHQEAKLAAEKCLAGRYADILGEEMRPLLAFVIGDE